MISRKQTYKIFASLASTSALFALKTQKEQAREKRNPFRFESW